MDEFIEMELIYKVPLVWKLNKFDFLLSGWTI